MKVLMINGSPQAGGCVYTALSEVGKALNEEGLAYQIIQLGNQPVPGCIACDHCAASGSCIYAGGPYGEIVRALPEASAIVVGSPVYYAGPNGSLCALLDRLFYSRGAELAHKPAAAVVSCRRGGASAAYDRLNKYFTINQMPVAASQYWNSIHGNNKEEALKDLEGLQTMRTLGHNLAWLIKSLGGPGTFPASKEKRISTNFIR